MPPAGIERRPVTTAARILQGAPVALVTSAHHGNSNVLPVAWHMPLSARPPLIGIAIEQSRHTVDLVRHGEQFALNFPPRSLVHHVQYLGAWSGVEIDKFEATQLETFGATHLTAPLVKGCVAWIECELQQSLTMGDHILFVGLAVAVHVDPRAFDERWLLTDDDARPLHYLGAQYYSVLGGVLEARLPRDAEAPERVLAERAAEELELTHEARERREELEDDLRSQVARGEIADIAQLTAQPSPGSLWTPPAE